jgi:2-polyprenyl-3-methyl-5-hydroxy-6-metoxy-1,4-benzoquinol methylase
MPGPQGPVRAVAYRCLTALARRTGKISNGFLYLAAGLLREDELQADSEARWLAFALSVDDADAGLGVNEHEFYSRFAGPRDRILLAGSGGGRDLIALHRLGYCVAGLEQVSALVELSRRRAADRGLTIPVEAGTIQTARPRGSYDVVIFSLGCYSYVRGSAARVATLTGLAAHLNPGGRVVLSYHPRSGQTKIAIALTRLTALMSLAGWMPETGDVFSRDYAVREVLRYHHEFTPEELSSECARGGFQIVADESRGALRFAALTGEPPQRP